MSAIAVRRLWRIRWLLIVALVFFAVVLRVCVLRPGSSFPGSHFNAGHNAAWLGVEWPMEPHSIEEVAALTADLRARQVSTIYVYVSYLKPGGTFNPTYDHAPAFVANLKEAAPYVNVQAWLGIPLAAPEGVPIASGYIDLSDVATRWAIVEFSQFAIHDLGFDGVHLDAEPVLSGDAAMLALLDEVRAAIGPDARLSVSAREITPLFPETDLVVNRWFTWRADYYREVVRRVNEVAVMTYDSHAPTGWLFEQWVRFQVIALTNSLADMGADVYIGISTSEEHTASHNPAAENMQSGLAGLIAGLNDADARPGVVTGVAIYPYWGTSDDEWVLYTTLWLGR